LQRCIFQLLHRSLSRDDALPVGAAATLAHRALPTYRLAAAVCILHVAPQRALAEASIAAALSCTVARPMVLRIHLPPCVHETQQASSAASRITQLAIRTIRLYEVDAVGRAVWRWQRRLASQERLLLRRGCGS